MKILVTGARGFLGRHLLARLSAYPSECDLRDQQNTFAQIRRIRPDLIIHAAGHVGGIGANQAHPAQFFYDNLQMGINIIEAAHWVGKCKVVIIGTTCSYPRDCAIPFKETDLWNGYPEETNAPYGIAKRALLTMAQAYRAEYGLNVIYLIPANLYGIGDHFDDDKSHVIPALIKRFVKAKRDNLATVTLWGDGTPTREFLNVKDAARGIVIAAEIYNGAAPLNLGGAPEISICALAELIAELTGYSGAIEWDTTKPNGQPRRQLDATQAELLLDWRAEIPLRDGLREVIDWYQYDSNNTGIC